MGDPPRRQPSAPRIVREENVAPQLTAKAATRAQTANGMPPPIPKSTQRGHDDIEHVQELERLERERGELLAENKRLREIAPTVVFPPPSIPPQIPPPGRTPEIVMSSTPADIKAIEKMISGSKLGRRAVVIGVIVGVAWNAFNTVRQQVPLQKVEAAQARIAQSDQISQQEASAQALERQRTLQALRAIQCWGKQTRGGFQRQGLDLTTLPAGGIKVLRLGDEDPNRPGSPKFIVDEKCPDFPPLPPDGSAR